MKKSEAYQEWLKRPDVKKRLSIWNLPGVWLIAGIIALFALTFITSLVIYIWNS